MKETENPENSGLLIVPSCGPCFSSWAWLHNSVFFQMSEREFVRSRIVCKQYENEIVLCVSGSQMGVGGGSLLVNACPRVMQDTSRNAATILYFHLATERFKISVANRHGPGYPKKLFQEREE